MYVNNLAYRINAKVVYKNLSTHSIEYTTYRDYDYFKCRYVDTKKQRVVNDSYRRNLEYQIAIETITECDFMVDDSVEIGEEVYRITSVDETIDDRNPNALKPHKKYVIYLQQ